MLELTGAEIVKIKLRVAFFGAAIAVLIQVSQAQSGLTPAPGHWPQWRGPNRDNVSTETGLLREWPEGGPPLLWKASGLGNGVMSLAVAGGRIYLLGYGEDHQYIVSLDGGGKIVWRSKIGRTDRASGLMLVMRWLTQRTPTVDRERLYAFTVDGELICLSAADGQELWRKDYIEDFEGKRGPWGYCDFPLVDGDKLICTPGGPANTIVALDKKTGQLLWKCAVSESRKCTYSSMIVAELGGVRQYVNQLGEGVVGVAAGDGRLLWHYPKMTHKYGNVHTAMIWNDAVFTLCGWGLGCALLKPVPGEEGFDIEERYKAKGDFDSWISSSIRIGNDVYSFTKDVSCVDISTGEQRWKSGSGYARPPVTYADGRFYVRRGDGNVKLAEATLEGITLHGEFDVPPSSKARTWTFPVVAGGRLYLRDQDLLYCYDVRGKRYKAPRAVWETAKPIAPPLKNTSSKEDVAGAKATRDRGTAVEAIFVPSPQDIVEKMLEVAKVTKDDIVYDLGSGEGRIVITAAKVHGCKSIGYEIDKSLVSLSRENARKAKVEDLVTIEEMDLFKADLSEASVVTLYLGTTLNRKLVRQLDKLRPGSRVISHEFDIPGTKPDKVVKVVSQEDDVEHTIYLWTTPLKRE